MIVKTWCENTKEGMDYLTFNGYKPICRIWKNYWLDTTNLSEEKVEELMNATLTESSISEEEIRNLLSEAGFHRIANFFKTNHFGGWICHAL